MADTEKEGSGLAGGSKGAEPKSSAPAQPAPGESEARILEEVVVKRKKPAPPAVPASPTLPTPQPVAPAVQKPPAPETVLVPASQAPEAVIPELIKKQPADAPKKAPTFAPLPPVFKPAPKIQSEVPVPPQASTPSTPAPVMPPAAAHVSPVVAPELKPPPPAPPAKPISETPLSPSVPETPVPNPRASATSGGGLDADIAKILEGVKLPERMDNKLTRETKSTAPVEASDALQDAIAKESMQNAAPEVPGVVTPRGAEKEGNLVTPVHTLKDDLQGAVKDQKMSLVRAVSLEENRRNRDKPRAPADNPGRVQRSRRTAGIVFGILLLVLLGAGALFGIYAFESAQSAAPAAPATSILFAETSVSFALDNHSPGDIKQVLSQVRNSSKGTLGSITRIVPTVLATSTDGTSQIRPATFSEFMAAMGANPPSDLLRALSSQFFFGIHTVDTNAPLFVIPVLSYDHAFAGMLAWESTMNSDLAPLFTLVPATTKDQNGLPSQRTFTDLVMRNYDVRALKDDGGNIVLYYSFPTQNILVIAQSPYTFTEVLNRLQAQREL